MHFFAQACRRACRLFVVGLAASLQLWASGSVGLPLENGPAWWRTRSVLINDAQADDYAAVNQGQLKHIASQARAELDAYLPGGAGPELSGLVNAWSTPGTATDDYAAANLGQVKHLAALVYDRLIATGHATAYPWAGGAQPADDHALANLGQVKNLFNFDIAHPLSISVNSMLTFTLSAPAAVSYQTWIAQYPGLVQTGYLDTPAGDGVANLLKYALGLNPTQSSAVAMPEALVVQHGGLYYLALRFDMPDPPRPDLIYTLEVSSNLMGNWTTVADPIILEENPQPPGLAPGLRRINMLDEYPLGFFGGIRFLRLRATLTDPGAAENSAFLVKPAEAQNIPTTEGVRFAFDLDLLGQLPGKICVFQRPASGGAWIQIGRLTDFAERHGVRFLRGSAIWLPDGPGDYEVLTEAFSSTGQKIASARRIIHYQQPTNTPPAITIAAVSGLGYWPECASLAVTVSDADGDTIRKVEYYDNGVLFAQETGAFSNSNPPGDALYYAPHPLMRGAHSITAKAYDARGAVGVSNALNATIATGNARPELTITAPAAGTTLAAGQPLVIQTNQSDADGNGTIVRLAAFNPYYGSYGLPNADDRIPPLGPLPLDTSQWSPGPHTVQIWCEDNQGARNLSRTLDIWITSPASATLAQDLVDEITDEASVTISNIRFTGHIASSLVFTGGHASGLEMDQGALLTTGDASDWNRGNVTTGNLDEPAPSRRNDPGDQALANYVGEPFSYDAAALELNATCAEGQLNIEYQFGSEEYMNYVGSVNDAFWVLIDDVPVSLLPDAAGIITVNSVNLNANRHLYMDNDAQGAAIAELVAPDNSKRIEYDGVTIRVKSHVMLKPGSTHRLRLVISDISDDRLDSGVFLPRNSLLTTQPTP